MNNLDFYHTLIYFDILKDSKAITVKTNSGSVKYPAIDENNTRLRDIAKKISSYKNDTETSFIDSRTEIEKQNLLGITTQYFVQTKTRKMSINLLGKVTPIEKSNLKLINANNKFICIDASISPDKFISTDDYTIIETPGSFIDPASREQPTYIIPTEALAKINLTEHGFNDLEISVLEQNEAAGDTYFRVQLDGKYIHPFTIKMKIYRNSLIKPPEIESLIFNGKDVKNVDVLQQNILQGNKKKNEFCNTLTGNDDVILFKKSLVILFKALGDSLQTIFIDRLNNYDIPNSQKKFKKSDTYFLTIDINAAIRCKLLEINYLLYNRSAHLITYFLVGEKDEILKAQISNEIDKIIKNNKDVKDHFENIRTTKKIESLRNDIHSMCRTDFIRIKACIDMVNEILETLKVNLNVIMMNLVTIGEDFKKTMEKVLITFKIPDIYTKYECKVPTKSPPPICDKAQVIFNDLCRCLLNKHNGFVELFQSLGIDKDEILLNKIIKLDEDTQFFPNIRFYIERNCPTMSGGSKKYKIEDEDTLSIDIKENGEEEQTDQPMEIDELIDPELINKHRKVSIYNTLVDYIEIFPILYYILVTDHEELIIIIRKLFDGDKNLIQYIDELIKNKKNEELFNDLYDINKLDVNSHPPTNNENEDKLIDLIYDKFIRTSMMIEPVHSQESRMIEPVKKFVKKRTLVESEQPEYPSSPTTSMPKKLKARGKTKKKRKKSKRKKFKRKTKKLPRRKYTRKKRKQKRKQKTKQKTYANNNIYKLFIKPKKHYSIKVKKMQNN